MGKTRRHHGRENGERAKSHRWWRKNEGFCTRKDTDRFKVAQAASAAVRHEGISLKTRNTTVPRTMETKGYGYRNHPFTIHDNGWCWTASNPIDPDGWYGEDFGSPLHNGGCSCEHHDGGANQHSEQGDLAE